ncbi:MAG: acetate/propionate family kinase [Micavibrio sp.]|nr:acetate/propionate family kinase [Micavibrio sp.]
MTAETYLVINAGSSTIKYALYDANTLALLEKKTLEMADKAGYDAAFNDLLKLVEDRNVKGVAHRVVHGGRDYAAPQKLDDKVLADLEALTPLAPLHQPHNLKPAKLVMDKFPNLPQVACFDTAFHRTQPRLNQLYALPKDLTDEGVLRYGFHGSSYEYIAAVLPAIAGDDIAKGRVIVAHLGSGASVCAMKDGKSVASSMGFTPLDGLMMGTRTGAIDPGVPLYLMEQKGLSAKSISDIFQKHSGLKGVSGGISNDMRVLLNSPAPEAKEAVDLFCLYAARQIAALTVDLGGLDALVFTAGIGENSGIIREKICGHLKHLGVTTDAKLNAANGPAIHDAAGSIAVYVIKTNEELMMARHIDAVIQRPPAPKPPQAPKI